MVEQRMRLAALLTFRGMMRDGDTLDNVKLAEDGGIYYSVLGRDYHIRDDGDVYIVKTYTELIASRHQFRG